MENASMKVTINGDEYVRVADIPKLEAEKAMQGKHVIVIAQRNWVFEGYIDGDCKDRIRLRNANNIRSWSNGRGLCAFAKAEYKDEYTLDFAGTVEFAPEGIVAMVDVEW